MFDSHARRYLDQLVTTFSVAAGHELPLGASVVPFTDRTSSTVVAYTLPGRTVFACGPAVADRIGALAGTPAVSDDELVARCAVVGLRKVDEGVNLVLPAAGVGPELDDVDPTNLRWLDRDDADDLALLDRFVDASSDDDLEAVELVRDEPDPAIVVALDADGEIAAYASGRPFWAAPQVDDVGVLVAPDHRGCGLARAVVAAFVARRSAALPQLYRHDVANVGSAAVARSVGFVEVHRVHAFTLDA